MKRVYFFCLVMLMQTFFMDAMADEPANREEFSEVGEAVALDDVNQEALKQITAQVENSPFAIQAFKKLSFDQELIHAKYQMGKEYVEFTPLKNGWVIRFFENSAGITKTLSLAGVFNVLNGAGLKVKQLSLPKNLKVGEKLSFDLIYEDGYQIQNECTIRRAFYAHKISSKLSGGAVLFACQGKAGNEGSFNKQTFEQVWLEDYGVMIDYDSIQAVSQKKPYYLKYYEANVVR